MGNRRTDPSLGKIIAVLSVVALAVLGVLRFSDWFTATFVVARTLESASDDLAQARQLMDEGNLSEARKHIEPIIELVKDDTHTPAALELLAELEGKAGNIARQIELLKSAAYEYPQNANHMTLVLEYATLLDRTGRSDEAAGIFQDIQASAPPAIRASATFALARRAQDGGEVEKAMGMYAQVVEDAEWGSNISAAALGQIGNMNVSQVFAQRETPGAKYHIVKSGETLTSIGVKYNVTLGQLMRANGITDPSKLRLNQRLKYTPKDFRIVVERSTCSLYLLDGQGIFKRYSTGLGRPGHETTLGKYRIGDKQKDPVWFRPNGPPVPSGDPENELGTRWMPMVPDEENLPHDLGIHGTIHPESIGKYSSSGCPRLLPEDVEELYDLVVRATPVEVVEVFEFEALQNGGGEAD